MRSQHFLAGGRVAGNREVSRPLILVVRDDLSGARDEAIPKEAEVRERERRGAPAAV